MDNGNFYIFPSHLQILGKGEYTTCLNLLNKIKKKLGKNKEQQLSVYEYCAYMKDDVEKVKEHLGFTK